MSVLRSAQKGVFLKAPERKVDPVIKLRFMQWSPVATPTERLVVQYLGVHVSTHVQSGGDEASLDPTRVTADGLTQLSQLSHFEHLALHVTRVLPGGGPMAWLACSACGARFTGI